MLRAVDAFLLFVSSFSPIGSHREHFLHPLFTRSHSIHSLHSLHSLHFLVVVVVVVVVVVLLLLIYWFVGLLFCLNDSGPGSGACVSGRGAVFRYLLHAHRRDEPLPPVLVDREPLAQLPHAGDGGCAGGGSGLHR
jgi:hypothetical protein